MADDSALIPASPTRGYTVHYQANVTQGYYLLQVINTEAYSRIYMSWCTDPYRCPYNPTYPDFYSDFLGCNNPISPPGIPCLTYDNVTGSCTACISGWTLVAGTCQVNVTCPSRQYYHYGNCYPVNSTCDTFDPSTGGCVTCITGYYINGTVCILIIPLCSQRQYLSSNNTCVDVSVNCGDFDSQTGACLNCVNTSTSYQLLNGTCIPIVITCPTGQYLSPTSQSCVDLPVACTNFDIPT